MGTSLGGSHNMTPIPPLDRVAIWNGFFRLAWSEVKAIFELENNCTVAEQFSAGPTPVLPEDEFHVLAAVLMCALAIEARANHLLDEFVQEGKVSQDVADAVRRLPPKHKWFLLPSLVGNAVKLDAKQGPHQAVAQLCELRNDFIHVNYAGIKARLQDKGQILSYFRRFVQAIDDMNVMLNRPGAPNPALVARGSFWCS